MKLIIGLGNPGQEYINTRHNIGFKVLQDLKLNFKLNKKFNAEICKEKNIIYALPQTFMNNSGLAVKKIIQFYKIKPADIFVIYDDKDLPIGKIRLRIKGSSGGHNGLKSIIQELGTENFNRLRIGISNPNKTIKNTANFVLGKFTGDENTIIKKVTKSILEIIDVLPKMSFEKIMNQYNAASAADKEIATKGTKEG